MGEGVEQVAAFVKSPNKFQEWFACHETFRYVLGRSLAVTTATLRGVSSGIFLMFVAINFFTAIGFAWPVVAGLLLSVITTIAASALYYKGMKNAIITFTGEKQVEKHGDSSEKSGLNGFQEIFNGFVKVFSYVAVVVETFAVFWSSSQVAADIFLFTGLLTGLSIPSFMPFVFAAFIATFVAFAAYNVTAPAICDYIQFPSVHSLLNNRGEREYEEKRETELLNSFRKETQAEKLEKNYKPKGKSFPSFRFLYFS